MINPKIITTNEELDKISKEVDCIAEYLPILNPNDPMEYQLREQLWSRWDFLRKQVKDSLAEIKKRRFQVVPDHLKH